MLEKLSKGAPRDALMAYQIAFDMYESATQQFLSRVLAAIKKTAPVPQASATAQSEKMDTEEKEGDGAEPKVRIYN